MRPLQFDVAPLAFAQTAEPWLPGLQPYAYQSRVYDRVREALTRRETLCLFLVTPTGSGKTLASYAYPIMRGEPAFGVYPTNELIRDQEAALRPWLDASSACCLLRVDSAQLDRWQDALQLPRHALTLERLMNWEPTILTNPDILFYTFFGLYRGSKGLTQRLFALVARYRLFVFDEFHLYNVKQMADVAFLVGALEAINPRRGRVFVFASATPESPALPWLRDRLRIATEVIEAEPCEVSAGQVIAHPLQLLVVPADLRHWRGVDALLEHLPVLQQMVRVHPQTRLVAILDSVAGAIRLAASLRDLFPGRTVGEVHGFSSDQEREQAIRQRFTVGTASIEVGIDFRGDLEKDVLVFEARTCSQFVQRLGRLARHRKLLATPNVAIAVVPEYVYQYLASHVADGTCLTRAALYQLVDDAYQTPEDFARYLQRHAAAEFHEAAAVCRGLFQPDDRERIGKGLIDAIQALTGKTAGQAWSARQRYSEQQILKPLLTFRSGSLEAAIVDERGVDRGFPAKRYDLFFLLRRGVFAELDEDEFRQRLTVLGERWPEEAAWEVARCQPIASNPEELLGVYGYFALKDLLTEARKVWFELGDEQASGHRAQVSVVSGLELVTDPPMRLRRLNRRLRRKGIAAWLMDRHPAAIKLGRALPPLFGMYELRVRRPGGGLSVAPWTIAFNQDAFFLDSLGWWAEQRQDQAILL